MSSQRRAQTSTGGSGDSSAETTSAVPSDSNETAAAQWSAALRAAAGLARAANGLPRQGLDYELYASYPDFADEMGGRLRDLLSTCGCRVRLGTRAADAPDELVERIVDANDQIVERLGIMLDEAAKTRRDADVQMPKSLLTVQSNQSPLLSTGTKETTVLVSTADPNGFKIPLTSQPLGLGRLQRLQQQQQQRSLSDSVTGVGPHRVMIGLKPQQRYGIAQFIDNEPKRLLVGLKRSKAGFSFAPRLHTKPNALPLKDPTTTGIRIRNEQEGDDQKESEWTTTDEAVAEHPYVNELQHWVVPKRQLQPSKDAREPGPISDTEAVLVDTLEGLKKLCDDLNSAHEFAVDLESNSYRTFQGITCLMQISTRTTDYLVDPFPIWQHMHLLNDPFTNPDILKVFHGADSDVLWLQRDFGIYLVNMFDTHQAMRRLNYSRFSLQHLVETHCNGVILEKAYQMADWRIRPLPDDFAAYARSDTHYLLHCYDKVLEELLQNGNKHHNLVLAVYDASREVALKPYQVAEFNPRGYFRLIGRRALNNRQLAALEQLWAWRDRVAREDDESTTYVLPDIQLLRIAEDLPREMQGILACCTPTPLSVLRDQLVLHRIVLQARALPLEETPTGSSALFTDAADQTTSQTRGAILEAIASEANHMTKSKSVIRCPLDFSCTPFDEEIANTGAIAAAAPPSAQAGDDGVSPPVTEKAGLDGLHLLPHTKDRVEQSFQGGAHVVGGGGGDDVGNTNKIMTSVAAKLDSWATPYECYLIAVRKAEEKRKREAAEQAAKDKTASSTGDDGSAPKKRYSHYDKEEATDFRKQQMLVTGAIDPHSATQTAIGESSGGGGEIRAEIDEEQTLTKKALQRKRKMMKSHADVGLAVPAKKQGRDVQFARNRQTLTDEGRDGRRPKDERQEEGEVDDKEEEEAERKVVPVDYSAFDRSMFNVAGTTSTDYDPLRAAAGNSKKPTRRGGARGRGGRRGGGGRQTGSVSYKK